MSATKYTASRGARLSDKDAETIGPLIGELAKRDGVATARALLEEARNPENPAHRYFEWDDAVAAEKQRLAHAGLLIRWICVVIETPQQSTETRAFHVVTTGEQRGYVPAEQVFASPSLSGQVVDTALKELRGWQLRYQQYRTAGQLAGVFSAIDEAVAPQSERTAIAAE